MKNIPSGVISLKRKANELDVDKLVPALVNLSKLSVVVKNDVVKKDVCNGEKNTENKVLDITILATKTTLNAKINETQGQISSISKLATATALAAVENKVPNVSNLVTKNWL